MQSSVVFFVMRMSSAQWQEGRHSPARLEVIYEVRQISEGIPFD